MTDEQLAAIKARLSAALPGPWTGMTIRRSLDGDCLAIVRQQENGGATIAATVVPTYSDRDTIPLFLHARADMDALVAEVERLRAEVSYLRACVPPVHPTDYGHEAWTETIRAAVAEERGEHRREGDK